MRERGRPDRRAGWPTARPRTAAAGRGRRRRAWTTAVEVLAGEFDPRARRVRRRAEVPAVDGAGVPAAPPRAHRLGRGAADGASRPARRWPAAACTTSSPAGSPATASTRRWVVPHFEKMLYDNALLLRVVRAPGRGAPGAPLARARRRGDRRRSCCATCARRGRVRLGAGRRHRRRRGPDLRLDAGAAARGARRRTTARWAAELLRGHRRRARSSTASSTLQLPARPGRPGRAGTRAGARCSTARGAAPAAGPRRQGGHRVERAGDRRAGRGRCRARAARSGSPRPGDGRRAAAGPARRGRAAAPVVARRRGRRAGGGAGGPRLPRRGAARAAPGHRRGAAGSSGRRPPARRDPGALRRPGPATGIFFDTADDAEALLHRPRELTDNATPCGSSALASALLTASVLVRRTPARYRDAAEAALRGGGHAGRAAPAVRRALAHRGRGDGCAGRCRWPSSATGAEVGRCWRTRRRIAAGGTVVVAGRAGRAGRAAAGRARRWSTARAGGLRVPRLRLRPAGHHRRRARRAAAP